VRVSTSTLFRNGLNAMQQQQSGIAKAQQQIATGKRILAPSDDPVGAQRVLDLQQSLGLNQRYQQNGTRAAQRLAVEETALDGVMTALQRVRELAIQGNNDTHTAEDRQAIALEIEERLEELVSLANAQDGNGEFLFAGNATRTKPFARIAGGSVVYNGDDGQRRLPVGPEYQVAVGDAGSEVFMAIPNGNGTFVVEADPTNSGEGIIGPGTVLDAALWASSSQSYTITFNNPPDSFDIDDGSGSTTQAFVSGEAITFAGVEVTITGQPAAGDSFSINSSANQDLFQTVQNVIDALRTPSGANAKVHNAVNRFLTDVDQSMERINVVRAEIGARLNAVETQGQANEDFALQLSETISTIQDVDYAEAISRLNQHLVALEASQQSFLRVQDLSLFRFL
jgi:flagellar hook-associated protein 3 FlgL